MTKFEQDQMREALDVVNRLKNDCIAEPDNKDHQQALVCAVRHYNQLGFAFKLTRDFTQCRRIVFRG